MGHSSERPLPTIDDMSDHELPASVRVSLWSTLALTGRIGVTEIPRLALPDVDESVGLVEAVRLWGSLGEQVVLAALPRPGDHTGMPNGSPELVDAATHAQECVYVPAVGGALVPELSTFGPQGDQGWMATWTSYPADPVPTHRIEALDLGQIELLLRSELSELTEQLLAAGPVPFGSLAERGAARARSARDGARSWGLPDGLPQRAVRVIDLAGTVLTMADAGLDAVPASLDSATARARGPLLSRLQRHATRALADATNVAALHLAFR